MPSRIIATIKVNTPSEKPANPFPTKKETEHPKKSAGPQMINQAPIIISSESLEFINLSLAFLVNSVKTNEERQNILNLLLQSLNIILQNQVQLNVAKINEEPKKKDAILPWTSNLADLKNKKSEQM
jgi:hypothetical protein